MSPSQDLLISTESDRARESNCIAEMHKDISNLEAPPWGFVQGPFSHVAGCRANPLRFLRQGAWYSYLLR